MTSLSKNARVAGVLYIVATAAGIVRLLYVPNALFVHGNATATANNIAAHELLFRTGIATSLLSGVLWLFVPLALYRLLQGVDRTLAVLMVILGSLMQTPIFAMNTVTDAAALMLVRGADSLSVIGRPQRDALAMLFLGLHHELDVVNSVFWGLWLLPFGLLVYRSRFLPRVLGVWLMVGCFAWLAFCFAGLLFPAYEERVFSMGQIFSLGEVVTMLWLVVMGAKRQRVDATPAIAPRHA